MHGRIKSKMDIGSKEFQEYCDKANIPNSHRIWANCMWEEAQKQATDKFIEGITPSGDTKSFHRGEYTIEQQRSEYDENGEIVEYLFSVMIPWDSIKAIMYGIRRYIGVDG